MNELVKRFSNAMKWAASKGSPLFAGLGRHMARGDKDATFLKGFVTPDDPGAVGANLFWLDPNLEAFSIRNAQNTAWVQYGGGGMLKAQATLTDTQIKKLHSTPFQIAAGPGAGKYIVVYQAVIRLTAVAGYTGIDDGAAMSVAGTNQTGFLFKDTTTPEPSNYLQSLLSASGIVILSPAFEGVPPFSFQWRAIPSIWNPGEDAPLYITFDFQAGDLTGGHPNNKMKVIVYYTIEDIV